MAPLEPASVSGDLPWEDVEAVGGWWNHRFDPGVEPVGADRGPVPGASSGSSLLRGRSPYDREAPAL